MRDAIQRYLTSASWNSLDSRQQEVNRALGNQYGEWLPDTPLSVSGVVVPPIHDEL